MHCTGCRGRRHRACAAMSTPRTLSLQRGVQVCANDLISKCRARWRDAACGVALALAAGAAELAPHPTEQDRVWLLGAAAGAGRQPRHARARRTGQGAVLRSAPVGQRHVVVRHLPQPGAGLVRRPAHRRRHQRHRARPRHADGGEHRLQHAVHVGRAQEVARRPGAGPDEDARRDEDRLRRRAGHAGQDRRATRRCSRAPIRASRSPRRRWPRRSPPSSAPWCRTTRASIAGSTATASAITQQEWRGYQVFKDPTKGNCAVCHSAPNFTDNGYHNIGIAHAHGRRRPGPLQHPQGRGAEGRLQDADAARHRAHRPVLPQRHRGDADGRGGPLRTRRRRPQQRVEGRAHARPEHAGQGRPGGVHEGADRSARVRPAFRRCRSNGATACEAAASIPSHGLRVGCAGTALAAAGAAAVRLA